MKAITDKESQTTRKDKTINSTSGHLLLQKIELTADLTNYDPSLDLSLQENLSVETVLKGGIINKILGYHRLNPH